MFQRVFEYTIFMSLSNEYSKITLESNTIIFVTFLEKCPQNIVL